MPSAPAAISPRNTAARPVPGREYTSHEGAEAFQFTLAANALFQTACQFSGRPDSITVHNFGAGNIFVRFRDPGEAPTPPFTLSGLQEKEFPFGRRIVELQDPSATGGEFVDMTARFASRAVDERNHEGGPRRGRTMPRSHGPEPQLDEY